MATVAVSCALLLGVLLFLLGMEIGSRLAAPAAPVAGTPAPTTGKPAAAPPAANDTALVPPSTPTY